MSVGHPGDVVHALQPTPQPGGAVVSLLVGGSASQMKEGAMNRDNKKEKLEQLKKVFEQYRSAAMLKSVSESWLNLAEQEGTRPELQIVYAHLAKSFGQLTMRCLGEVEMLCRDIDERRVH